MSEDIICIDISKTQVIYCVVHETMDWKINGIDVDKAAVQFDECMSHYMSLYYFEKIPKIIT